MAELSKIVPIIFSQEPQAEPQGSSPPPADVLPPKAQAIAIAYAAAPNDVQQRIDSLLEGKAELPAPVNKSSVAVATDISFKTTAPFGEISKEKDFFSLTAEQRE